MGDDVAVVSDQLVRAMDGGAWHGSALEELIATVDAETAYVRPIPGAHSIVELVLHLAAWTDEVAARLGGREPQEPDAGDWPDPDRDPQRAWQMARESLRTSHQRLLGALGTLTAAALDRRVGSAAVPALGTGHTVRGMLHGLAQHHAYHGGQIALLARAAGR